jgi:hypothetical protein
LVISVLPEEARMKIRCKYLRTKMDYVAHAAAQEPVVAEGVSQRHYWCLRTMKPLGPDDKPADEVSCAVGRECFVAEGEA